MMVEPGPSLLLDTCALIWVPGDETISAAAADALNRAHRAGQPVYVSPITAWEVGLLIARGRLACLMKPQLWFQRLLWRLASIGEGRRLA
jgi:PIN domain nuclease of toxin-antitoxin system